MHLLRMFLAACLGLGVVILLLCVVLLETYTPFAFWLMNKGADPGGIKVETNVAYGQNPGDQLDIYVPPHEDGRKLPVIVFFYGGRWEFGARAEYRFAGLALANAGFIAVIPDYRKYPAVRFPAFVQDGAKALAWTADHIAAYGGDLEHIHVAGHSAGAHIGALLAADPSYLAAFGKTPEGVIRSFAGLAGPYDFTPDESDLIDMFGPPERYPEMQVTTFITGREPPMLLLYGMADTVVKRSNLDKLQKKIEEDKGCVRAILYPGVTHGWILAALSWFNVFAGTPVLADMVAFFKATDASKGCPTE